MEDIKLEVLENYAKDNLSNVTFTKNEDGVYIGSDSKRYLVYTEDEVATLYNEFKDILADNIYKDTCYALTKLGYSGCINYIKVDIDAIDSAIDQTDMETILDVKYVLEELKYYEGDYYTICEE